MKTGSAADKAVSPDFSGVGGVWLTRRLFIYNDENNLF
jgi:hypothetical protein